MNKIQLQTVNSEEQYLISAELFRAYAASLDISLDFQGFEDELENLKEMYGNRGAIILALLNGQYAGCIAVRNKGNNIAELKRMYVHPEFQHQGIGAALLEAALDVARKSGYDLIRLDTLSHMKPAISLYEKSGFYQIPPYYFNPEPTAVFFEKKLTDQVTFLG